MAPDAKLVYLDMFTGVDTSNCTDFICDFCSVSDILQQEYEAGHLPNAIHVPRAAQRGPLD